MGIGEKREKGVTAMKRFSLIFLTLMFALCTLFSNVQFSFADNEYGEETLYDTEYTEEDNEAIDPTVKDTSWFDYQNPMKEYEISTEGQLIGLASLVNEEQVDNWKPERIETFEGVTFTLKNDIKLTKLWTPIGSGTAYHFSGIFDGDGHTISGLKTESSSGATGFFGYLVGTAKNLTVQGEIKSKSDKCGGIAGHLDREGSIEYCTSNVNISGKDKTGGIVGYNEGGYIEQCTNLGKVSGTYKIGGIVGENWGGVISECHNMGEISSSERGIETYGTGGIAGRSVSADSKISKSYNMGIIISNTEATGGITGYTNAKGATIKDCYNMGNIMILNKNGKNKLIKSNAGGIIGTVGMKGVIIRNCYNAGQIKNADISGGIIGNYTNDSDTKGTFIKNNYYLHDKFKTGIGKCDDEKADEIPASSNAVSGNGLMNMASTLGSAYMRDSSNLYGNNGYPVLTWQQPMSEEERASISMLPGDMHKKLDKYLVSVTASATYGQMLIDFFNPENFISSSLVKYIEALEASGIAKSIKK